MSIETVRAFFAEHASDIEVAELQRSSETRSLSAAYIKPAQIPKALTLKVGDRIILLMASGDARVDNKKSKAALEQSQIVGSRGGVCRYRSCRRRRMPFGLAIPLPIYCDVLLRRFDVVVTGGGSTHSAIRISPSRMASLVGAQWVDVCQPPAH